MSKDHEGLDTAKLTVHIEKELYQRVKDKFHYGQLSKLFRNIFESLDKKIKEKELIDIVNYIYKETSITLYPVEKPNDSNGKNKG